MKTTDWYPGTVKPAYVGVYRRDLPWIKPGFSYFGIDRWGSICSTPEDAYAYRCDISAYQGLAWCGLTEPHCKKCGTQMIESTAIAQTWTGVADFLGGEVVTQSPGGPGKLIDCYKCPACGWSMTR